MAAEVGEGVAGEEEEVAEGLVGVGVEAGVGDGAGVETITQTCDLYIHILWCNANVQNAISEVS